MTSWLGKRYRIYLSDGSVERRTMFGDPKIEGDTIRLAGKKWTVVRSTRLVGEETDYEIHVRAPGSEDAK